MLFQFSSFMVYFLYNLSERAKVGSEWALVRAVQGQMARDNAIMDKTTHSPSLPSVQDDQAARLFLVDPGGGKVESS